jgi:hypothetical protein
MCGELTPKRFGPFGLRPGPARGACTQQVSIQLRTAHNICKTLEVQTYHTLNTKFDRNDTELLIRLLNAIAQHVLTAPAHSIRAQFTPDNTRLEVQL